jgi:hypothetical protein
MSSILTAGLVTLTLASLLARPLHGQALDTPAPPDFELPSASPRVHGLVGRLLSTRRGESQFGQEQEAEVALGENFPILSLRGGPNPISLGLGSQVYARFSLEDAQTAMISHDWVVGINTTALMGAWDFTLQLYHESSHLGDEYGDRFATPRLDWSREVLSGWVGYSTGPWRFAGNASYALVDGLGLSRPAGAAAIDFRSGPFLDVLGGGLRPTAGIFFAADGATAWRVSGSARLGVALPSRSGREIGVALIAHDGLSTQRQFYRRQSRYIGLELRFDL